MTSLAFLCVNCGRLSTAPPAYEVQCLATAAVEARPPWALVAQPSICGRYVRCCEGCSAQLGNAYGYDETSVRRWLLNRHAAADHVAQPLFHPGEGVDMTSK